jgi:hypothetical protein
VGRVFFPLDEELALLPGQLAPRQQEHLVHLAAWMSFEQAAQMLEALLQVKVSPETARRLSEQMGAWMDVAQAEEANPEALSSSEGQPACEQCVMSVDGAMISLVKKQWVEVRTLAIGEPHAVQTASGEQEVHVDQLSYFSQLADASSFTELAGVEMRRRRVAEAKAVCAVTDGADWCQAFAQSYRPDAARILDFPHAAEHLSHLLEALKQAGQKFPEKILERCLHLLKHRGPGSLLKMAEQIPTDLAQLQGVEGHLEYLRKREALMQYPVFRSQGWPIGSGMVESANKLVVQARLKGPGMHWERKHVNSMLALRLAVCNERWQEMWRKARQKRSQFSAQARAALPSSLASQQGTGSPSSAMSPGPQIEAALSQERGQLRKLKIAPSRSGSRDASHKKGGEQALVCSCGAPLVQFKGGRYKQYCSNRCRQQAFRKRSSSFQSFPSLPHQLKDQARQSQKQHLKLSLAPSFIPVSPDVCPCGTPLAQSGGGRRRAYCSDRCRQRAFRQRASGQRSSSSLAQPRSDQARQRQKQPLQPAPSFVKGRSDVCSCGTPLAQVGGGRHRFYCSDRCRGRAFRLRQAQNQDRSTAEAMNLLGAKI